MFVYGLELSKERRPCEHCGFPCFEDELRCPNCMKERASLLSDDEKTRSRQKSSYFLKCQVFAKVSKRARLIRVLFILATIVCVLAAFAFIFIQKGFYSWRFFDFKEVTSIAMIVSLTVMPYILLFGRSGTQCCRTSIVGQDSSKNNSFFGGCKDFRYFKGFLRFFREGRLTVAIGSIALYVVITLFLLFFMPSFWIDNYSRHNIYVSIDAYVLSITALSLLVNSLVFLGYFLFNTLCPYDYQGEVEMRLKSWRKQNK